MCDSCEKTEFGCCIDLQNAARGPSFEGCPDDDTPAFIDCATTVSTFQPAGEKNKRAHFGKELENTENDA